MICHPTIIKEYLTEMFIMHVFFTGTPLELILCPVLILMSVPYIVHSVQLTKYAATQSDLMNVCHLK